VRLSFATSNLWILGDSPALRRFEAAEATSEDGCWDVDSGNKEAAVELERFNNRNIYRLFEVLPPEHSWRSLLTGS